MPAQSRAGKETEMVRDLTIRKGRKKMPEVLTEILVFSYGEAGVQHA